MCLPCNSARASTDALSTVRLRPALAADRGAINALSAVEGMDELDDIDNTTVALDANGQIIAFICLLEADDGAYINPIVVAPEWRRKGVGKRLIAHSFTQVPRLRLVSRGSSKAFYEALGFTPLPWSDIDPTLRNDCAACPWQASCDPMPMGKTLQPPHR